MNVMRYLGRGVRHEKTGENCQDFALYRYLSDGSLVMALSDGCSSAAHSEDAARITFEKVIEYFEKHTLKQFLDTPGSDRELLAFVNEGFRAFAPMAYCDHPEDFSATLLFAVTDRDSVLFGHVGDGNIIAFDKDLSAVAFSGGENGEGAEQTFFAVDPDAPEHFLFTGPFPFEKTDAVLMYSDGPGKMFFYDGDRDVVKAAAGFLSQLRAGRRCDCRTLAGLITRRTWDRVYQISDDWSVLLLDVPSKQCEDISFRPLSMKRNALKEAEKMKKKEANGNGNKKSGN